MKKTKEKNLPVEKPKIGRPREWTDEKIEIERVELEKWMDDPKNYFFTGFLNERKLLAQHVENFCKISPSFQETCARARQIQEQRIVEATLTRKFDSTFAKFVMQNKAGWKEKSEVSGENGSPFAMLLERIDKNADKKIVEIENEKTFN